MANMGLPGADAAEPELERGTIDVAGIQRTYWLARARRAPEADGHQDAPVQHGPDGTGRAHAPLLIALHGSGMDGRSMAHYTGLARRGPAAGITTVFPDGWKGMWHTARPPGRVPGLDDPLFLSALASHLEVRGAAESWPVFLSGVSNGAWFAEHVARHALLPVAGLFLVAGTALEVSRRHAPRPLLRARTVVIMGTGDPWVPYLGGRLTRHGLPGVILKRRAFQHGERPGEDVVAGAEDVAADWARGNGIRTRPDIEELPGDQADLPVTRKTWSAPGCRPVTLYRISGGGHGWPGGPQIVPARVAGQVTRNLDATGILLDMAEHEGDDAADRHTLQPGGLT